MIAALSLRARIIILMLGISLGSTGLALWGANRNAQEAIWEQVGHDAELLGSVIAETIQMSREAPDNMEAQFDWDLASTAWLLAEYVALVERSKEPRPEIERVLGELTRELGVDEVWITDSSGKVEYSSPTAIDFTFSPDTVRQPQASEFWPLLSGEAKLVTQRTMRRDLDGKVFKYVGVAGVGRPRIVKLGMAYKQIDEARSQLSLARINEELVKSGVLVRPILVVDEDLRPIDHSGAVDLSANATKKRDIDRHAPYLKEALASENTVRRMESDAAVMYRYYGFRDQRYKGAFVAEFRRDPLDKLLDQQPRTLLIIGALIIPVASLLGWFIAKRLTESLDRISRAARELQDGRFDHLHELQRFSGRRDEISRLGQVVHDMGNEVRNREAILEGQVRIRTEELAARNEALAATQALISGELELAQRLQLGILPEYFPPCAGYQGAARVRMQQQMGGDFYDFIPRADGSVALVMADVSGKGITAAFFMAMARTLMAEHLAQGMSVETCLSRANDALCRSNPLNLFVTVFVAVIDPRGGPIEYANAGHNPPVHIRRSGQAELLPMRGELALGVMAGLSYTRDYLALAPGEALLAYTDGITETFNSQGQAYGEHRLLQWARQSDLQSPVDQRLMDLFDDVLAFQGSAAQADDITMALIQRLQHAEPSELSEHDTGNNAAAAGTAPPPSP